MNPQGATPPAKLAGTKHRLSSPEDTEASKDDSTVACNWTPCLKVFNKDMTALKYEIGKTPEKEHQQFLLDCMEEAVRTKKACSHRTLWLPTYNEVALSGSEANFEDDVVPYFIRLKTVGQENLRPDPAKDWSNSDFCPLCDGITWEERCPWKKFGYGYRLWLEDHIQTHYDHWKNYDICQQEADYKKIRFQSYRQLARMVNGGPLGPGNRVWLDECLELRVKYWLSYNTYSFTGFKPVRSIVLDVEKEANDENGKNPKQKSNI